MPIAWEHTRNLPKQWSSAVVVEYYQIVEGKRPDLTVYNRSRENVAYFYKRWTEDVSPVQILVTTTEIEFQKIDRELEMRKVYIFEYDPELSEHYDFVTLGDYYQLVQK